MTRQWIIGVERQTFTTIEVDADTLEDAEREALERAMHGDGDFDSQTSEYVIVELVGSDPNESEGDRRARDVEPADDGEGDEQP